MAKSSFAVLLLLTMNLGNYFVKEQSTVGDCSKDEQDKHYSEALFAIVKSIQSELQNLKAQISRLEDRVERQKPSGARCPNGFNYTATGSPKCYAGLSQRVDWYTAQQNCREQHKDAHLAVINGTWENQIIRNITQDLGCLRYIYYKGTRYPFQYYWIGGQRQNLSDCSSAFVWKPDNKTTLPIGYTEWSPGEPNCDYDIEKCLSMSPNGLWNDLACNWTLCSICEVMAYI